MTISQKAPRNETAPKANFTLTADMDVTNNGYSHGFSHRYGLAIVPFRIALKRLSKRLPFMKNKK